METTINQSDDRMIIIRQQEGTREGLVVVGTAGQRGKTGLAKTGW